MAEVNGKVVKKVIKLINGEIVFGSVEAVDGINGQEILIKQPYQAQGGNIFPYGIKDLGNGPGAIQIHPMNVLWINPLEDFPEIQTAYLKATTNIEVNDTPKIIL